MPTIGVVIVSYNTRELLRACLVSLRACSVSLRVIVVDNVSADGSAAMVHSDFPEVALHALARNVGFAAGTNIGVRELEVRSQEPGVRRQEPASDTQHSLSDYVLLLNPDTVVHPGAIEALAAFLDVHPRVGAVGPRLLNTDGTRQPAAFRFPTLAMTALDLFPPGEVLPGRLYNSPWHGRYPQEQNDQPFPIDHPLGACILTRRAVIEQVGALDEQFFMYAEEVDWCYRVRQTGWAIWQVPAARVTHVGGAATRQFRAKMLVALYASRMRFFGKYYPARTIGWHRWMIRAGMLRLALLAWREYVRGTISSEELQARLWAYDAISKGQKSKVKGKT